MTAADTAVQASRPLGLGTKAALGFEILAAYAYVRWQLRRKALPEALTAVRSTPRRRRTEGETRPTGLRLGRAVVRTLSLLPTDSRCLMRSLVLVRLLARRGIEAQLILGVSSAERFQAHAWVELDGRPVLASGGGSFARLANL
jgi:hypothetical protein